MCGRPVACRLSNPQNLDIGVLLGSDPTESPFYKVLHAEQPPRMIMLANQFAAIHMRLWCVFEAFLAHELSIATTIAGSALHLLSGELKEFLQLKEGAAERMQAEVKDEVTDAVARVEHEPAVAVALSTLLPRVDDALQEVARAKLRVVLAEDADLLDFGKAECFSEGDRLAIRKRMAGKEKEATALVARLIRDVVCRTVRSKLLEAHREGDSTADLSDADLTSPVHALGLAAWLRAGRAPVLRLDLRRCKLSPLSQAVLERALRDRWLPGLQVDSHPAPHPALRLSPQLVSVLRSAP